MRLPLLAPDDYGPIIIEETDVAANDPATSVATPTGALQGVAVFGWDGTTWQPAGGAGASVATPTGALQGVAPFSWDGSAWQPSGRAQPGVATPSGVLDGVAVYTWSGSVWTPVGGTATPSTPSGALRGVAAFNWDGASWQPAGQAGPSVATPYGVLQGVAMFNRYGNAWAAAPAIPPGVTLDLSFMIPGAVPNGVVFTRASTATYFDSGGTMRTAAANVPRWDYNPATLGLNGVWCEEARTNLALWSGDLSNAAWQTSGSAAAPPTVTGNQAVAPDGTTTAARLVIPAVSGLNSVSIVYQPFTGTATPYAFSIWLKGSVGGEQTYILTSNNTLYYNARVTLTTQWQRFTVVTPALTAVTWFMYVGSNLRDTGATSTAAQTIYAWGGQVEAGGFATSDIPTTSVAVTRAAEQIAIPPGASYVAQIGTQQIEALQPVLCNKAVSIISMGDVGGNRTALNVTGGNSINMFDNVGALNQTVLATEPVGVPFKAAVSYRLGAQHATVNGGAISAAAGATLASPSPPILSVGCNGSVGQMCGYVRRARYWNRVLTDAELQSVTT